MATGGYGLISEDRRRIEEVEVRIAPTMVIGVGGTGQQVLLNLRRRFVEKYGDLKDYPIVGYLYIDTDQNDEEQNGIALGNDLLMHKLKFQPNEKVNINVKVSDYINQIDRHPHIKKWLNTSGDLAELGDLGDGAGQVRPASRLAFFDKFEGLRNALSTVHRNTISAEAKERMAELHSHIDVDYERYNIYVCFSLAGGTGSGAFIDLAFLLKELFPDENQTSVGFAILPSVFVNYGSRTLANGYAALKELNHYKFHNKFSPGWDQRQFATKLYDPPPFNYCYLIDGLNEGGTAITPQSVRYLYGLVADNIFQDFSHSTFAGYKRAVKINLVQYLADVYAYRHRNYLGDEVLNETFPCRYSAFGLSMISFPVDRIENACAYKLAGEVIDYWGIQVTDEGSHKVDKTILEEILPGINFFEGKLQRATKQVDRYDVIDALNRIDESGARFEDEIDRWGDTLEKNIMGANPPSWRNYILEEQEKYDQNFRGSDIPDRGKWGDFLKIMEDNKKRLIKRTTEDLEKAMGEITNDPGRGIGFSLSVLRRLKEILTSEPYLYLPRFKREQQEMMTEVTALSTAVNREISELMNIENKQKGWKRNTARELQVREFIVPLMKNHYKLRMKVRARKLAIEVCNELVRFIGNEADPDGNIHDSGLILKYKHLLESVQELRDYCERMYRFFRSKQDTLLVLNLYEEGELDKVYYPHYMGDPDSDDHEANLSKHSTDLLAELGVNNVTDLIHDISRDGVRGVGERILRYARGVFNNVENDFNVLDLFFQKHGNDAENVIRRYYSYGKTWLKGREMGGGFRLPLEQRKYYVGLPEVDNPNLGAFREALNNVISTNDPAIEIKSSANNAEIAFYSENVGFPPFYLSSIEDYRGKYFELLREGNDLHIDKNHYRFKDLIPLEAKQRENLIQSHRAFLLGTILGVFKIEPYELDHQTKTSIYSFQQELDGGFKRLLQLGEETMALDYIYNFEGHPPLMDQILKKVQEQKEKVSSSKRFAEYAAVLRYYLEEIYKMEDVAIGGGATRKVSSLESDILLEELGEIDKVVPEKEVADYKKKRESHLIKVKSGSANFTREVGDGKKLALVI